LASVLGEADRAFHAGELRFLWRDTLISGRRHCGCGSLGIECELWRRILTAVAADVTDCDDSDLRQLGVVVDAWHREGVAPENARTLIQTTTRDALRRPAVRYLDALASLYRRIAEATGATLIIDSSKWVADAALLRHIKDIRPFILHVTRDPRGVIASRQRKLAEQTGPMNALRRRWAMTSDSFGWNDTVSLSELLLSSGVDGMSIRYEDLVSDPEQVLYRIINRGVPLDSVPLTGRSIRLSGNHTVGGNRVRFRTGRVLLEEDDRWHTFLSPTSRGLVSALTWRHRRRYGYTACDACGRNAQRRRAMVL
jgi:hypothetical protein